jgi:hypothetical protein
MTVPGETYGRPCWKHPREQLPCIVCMEPERYDPAFAGRKPLRSEPLPTRPRKLLVFNNLHLR